MRAAPIIISLTVFLTAAAGISILPLGAITTPEKKAACAEEVKSSINKYYCNTRIYVTSVTLECDSQSPAEYKLVLNYDDIMTSSSRLKGRMETMSWQRINEKPLLFLCAETIDRWGGPCD
jgi:hypothetical protein